MPTDRTSRQGSPQSKRARNDVNYQKHRRAILADNPPCYRCGRPADTIDHIIPAAIADPTIVNDISNLRPACRSCNSSTGAAFGNRTRKTTQSGQKFLVEATAKTPQELKTIAKPYSIRVPEIDGDFVETYPRLESLTDSDGGSMGDDLCEFAEWFWDKPLLPYQQHLLRRIFSIGPDGRLSVRRAYLSMARQNGKSYLAGTVIAYWLHRMSKLRGEPQFILSVAHNQQAAHEFFLKVAGQIERKFGLDPKAVKMGFQHEEVAMPDGSKWIVQAASMNAGHSLSCDLIYADEIFGIKAEVLDGGLAPTQRAKRDPLFLMTSTAGDSSSKAMLAWRDAGLAVIDKGEPSSFYFAEYSPPPGVDPLSVEAWKWSNPGLGQLIELKQLRDECEWAISKGAKEIHEFIRSTANQFVAASTAWLEHGLFARQQSDTMPDGGILAVECSLTDDKFYGVRVGVNGDSCVAEVEFTVSRLNLIWDEIDKVIARQPTVKLAIGTSLEIHCPQRLKARTTFCGHREIFQWTKIVRQMIVDGRVEHHGSQLLIEHVERAVMAPYRGSVALSSSHSPGAIELCRAMVWAVALASRPQTRSRAVAVFAT